VAVNKCLHTVASSWTFINIKMELKEAVLSVSTVLM